MTIPKLRFKDSDSSEFPEWEEKKLGTFCVKIGSGKTPKGGRKIYCNDGVMLIRSQNVLNGILDLSDVVYITNDINESMLSTVLEEHDVLLNITGASIGRCCLYLCDKKANVNQHVCIIRLGKNADIIPEFLLQYILSECIQNQIKSYQNGGSREGLNFQQVSNFIVHRPSLPEQRKIASFLSTIDEIIQSTESELTAWQERKKGVMQKIFNREVRFKADDGSEFPEWEEKKFGDICVINPKTEEVEDEFLYMDLGSVDHGDWEEPEVMIKSKAPSRAQRVARVGDVFFQSVRPYNQGHFHYSEKKDKQVVASTGYIQIRMKNCDSGFIYQILYDAHFNQEVSIRCTGSNYPAINADDFSEIVIAYPCVEEQRKIADCLSSLDDVINQIQAELSAWKEFKKGLLQQMFV